MKITEIKIRKVESTKGHIGFVSCIIDNWLYLNNIAIFLRLNEPEKIRLVFPEKKVGTQKISIFHPLDSKAYYILEQRILEKLKELL